MKENKQGQASSVPALLRWALGLAYAGLFFAIMFAIAHFPSLDEARMQAISGFFGLGLIGAGVKVVMEKQFSTRFRNGFKQTVTPIQLVGREAIRVGVMLLSVGVLASAWSSVLWWRFFTE